MIPAGKSLRVAAYCRVSTDRDDQANSFESQQRYFREYIARQPGWELAGIFADEGLSGTSTKKRLAFQRMIACARARMLDLIVTKEISRFARNTLDSIYYTRELKRLGIGVLFLSDNLYTLDGDAELRLTILASIAQEESRRTSERVKWGQKRRMEQGVVFGRDLLGYDVRGGVLIVNEPGAQIVRDIFRKFVNDGKGAHTIARELNEAGVPAARGGPWRSSVILRILRNARRRQAGCFPIFLVLFIPCLLVYASTLLAVYEAISSILGAILARVRPPRGDGNDGDSDSDSDSGSDGDAGQGGDTPDNPFSDS